jgi:hypothetical protein
MKTRPRGPAARGLLARGFLVLGLAVGSTGAMGLTACGASLPRLTRKGEHDEVLRRAAVAKKVPRRRAARAYAQSLVALGERDHARAVLLRDFRRGGQLESLQALAELELSMGLEGMAAIHYARLLSQDRRILEGDEQACELFRGRARALSRADEPRAAYRDLQRVHAVCGDSRDELARMEDRELKQRIEPLAAERAGQMRALDGPPDRPPVRRAEREREIEASIERARASGADALLALAEEHELSLPPVEILLILAAERSGQLGPRLVGDWQLRRLIGHGDADRLLRASKSLDPALRAYVLLRLSRVISVPESEGNQEVWGTASLRGGGDAGSWRVFAASGDANAAELALNAELRSHLQAAEAEAAAVEDGSVARGEPGDPAKVAEGVVGAEVVPWWLRVEASSRTAVDLLALAALFDARDRRADGLRLRLRVIGEGSRRGIDGIDELTQAETQRLMLLSRPWEAMAVADVRGGPLASDLRPAAAAGIALHEALCPGGCPDSSGTVESVLGAEWVGKERERMDAVLRARAHGRAHGDSVCPSVAELLAADAVGPFSDVLRRALEDPGDPEVARQLAAEFESELPMVCRARIVAPLLREGGHQLMAAKLDQRLTHAPEVEGSRQLESQAKIALAAGNPKRARLRAIAAAGASADPRLVWERAAIDGRAAGAREYERSALRELLMHSPDLENAAARRALVLSDLRDADSAPNVKDPVPATLEAYMRVVAQHLEGVPAAERWATLEHLARAVERETWMDEDAEARVRRALWFEPGMESRHGPRAGGGPLSAREIAFADLGDLRVANERQLASDATNSTPTTVAIALALTGSARLRAESLAVLHRHARAAGEVPAKEFAELLLARLSAYPGRSAPMIEREEVLLLLVFGLDLAPTWIGG